MNSILYTFRLFLSLCPLFIIGSGLLRAAPDPINEYVHLDEVAVRNLQLKISPSQETTFEQTLFVIGYLSGIPERQSIVSSRIPGRIVTLRASEGIQVNKGDLVARVESRQIGNPPPQVPLYAPRSGTVIKNHIRLGEPISPDHTLLEITDLSQIWAIAHIPQNQAHQLKKGTPARIRISALGSRIIEGTLLKFRPTANSQSGTLEAIFLIENKSLKLRPGMRAEFSIITSKRPNVTVVPKEAVQGPLTQRVVYIKDFDLPHSFIKAPVTVGEQNDQFIEIKSGLFPGDEVVTQGAYLLGFAGGGNLSLKEALDAAHGHEHNEDGSEITEEQKRAKQALQEPQESVSSSLFDHFLRILCPLLLLLLICSELRNYRIRKKTQTGGSVRS